MNTPSIKLLASADEPDGLIPSKPKDQGYPSYSQESFFKSVQWSADGTTLFTSSYSNRISSYVLPETLLELHPEPLQLQPHSTLILPESSSAIAPCPYFALENLSTQTILTASTDHPIHLHYAFPAPPSEDGVPDQPKPLASFRLVKHETEAYLPIASLIWPAPGTHFVAGTTNLIALFDVSRPDAINSEPVMSIATIPSTRHIRKGNGIGMRGAVAALASQSREQGDAGLLAAGTWTRNMGLYDLQRAGDCVATWNVAEAAAEAGIGGMGVVQTTWSPCGRYLVVNERRSTGMLVYDIRVTNQLLAHLTGRDGETNQRLSCDVFPGTDAVGGFEVWAGTRTGGVVVYEGVGNEFGGVAPSWDWEAHGSAVGSAVMHMSGSVVATCSGSWVVPGEESESESSDGFDSSDDSSHEDSESESGRRRPFRVEETSLKVWNIGASNPKTTEQTPEV
ncbi:hypothetical protein OQA88_2876 [Cercophora sp. LCS_1]